MAGERIGENTNDDLVAHYCERWIVFGRQDAGAKLLQSSHLKTPTRLSPSFKPLRRRRGLPGNAQPSSHRHAPSALYVFPCKPLLLVQPCAECTDLVKGGALTHRPAT